MARVVLADDEEFVRYYLKTVMETMSYDIVAEVEKGDELVDVMNDYQPDILLLDVNMPNLTGTDFINQYADDFPQTCIVILTSASYVDNESLKNVSCVLRKDTPIDEMISSIEEAWNNFGE